MTLSNVDAYLNSRGMTNRGWPNQDRAWHKTYRYSFPGTDRTLLLEMRARRTDPGIFDWLDPVLEHGRIQQLGEDIFLISFSHLPTSNFTARILNPPEAILETNIFTLFDSMTNHFATVTAILPAVSPQSSATGMWCAILSAAYARPLTIASRLSMSGWHQLIRVPRSPASEMYINLLPDSPDDWILLSLSAAPGPATGSWQYATDAGLIDSGTVTRSSPASPPVDDEMIDVVRRAFAERHQEMPAVSRVDRHADYWDIIIDRGITVSNFRVDVKQKRITMQWLRH